MAGSCGSVTSRTAITISGHPATPSLSIPNRQFNRVQKYVVSETLSAADLTWEPTTIICGADLVKEVSALRSQPGGDIYVYGSVSVERALLTAQLLDELVLMIEPITLGGGKTLFPTDGEARKFELVSAQSAATGVQVCRFPAPPTERGPRRFLETSPRGDLHIADRGS